MRIGPVVRALWQRDPEDTPLVDLFWGLKAFAPTMYALDGGMDLLAKAFCGLLDLLPLLVVPPDVPGRGI